MTFNKSTYFIDSLINLINSNFNVVVNISNAINEYDRNTNYHAKLQNDQINSDDKYDQIIDALVLAISEIIHKLDNKQKNNVNTRSFDKQKMYNLYAQIREDVYAFGDVVNKHFDIFYSFKESFVLGGCYYIYCRFTMHAMVLMFPEFFVDINSINYMFDNYLKQKHINKRDKCIQLWIDNQKKIINAARVVNSHI